MSEWDSSDCCYWLESIGLDTYINTLKGTL